MSELREPRGSAIQNRHHLYFASIIDSLGRLVDSQSTWEAGVDTHRFRKEKLRDCGYLIHQQKHGKPPPSANTSQTASEKLDGSMPYSKGNENHLKQYLLPQIYDISFERQIIFVFLYHYKKIAHSHWFHSKRWFHSIKDETCIALTTL